MGPLYRSMTMQSSGTVRAAFTHGYQSILQRSSAAILPPRCLIATAERLHVGADVFSFQVTSTLRDALVSELDANNAFGREIFCGVCQASGTREIHSDLVEPEAC